MLNLLKKVFDYIMAVVAFPVNIVILLLYLEKLNNHQSQIDNLNRGLSNLMDNFGRTAEHYNRFSDSLIHMSNLYQYFKSDSDYMRLQMDELLFIAKHGKERAFDRSAFKVEVVQSGPQGTVSEIRGLSQTGKP